MAHEAKERAERELRREAARKKMMEEAAQRGEDPVVSDPVVAYLKDKYRGRDSKLQAALEKHYGIASTMVVRGAVLDVGTDWEIAPNDPNIHMAEPEVGVERLGMDRWKKAAPAVLRPSTTDTVDWTETPRQCYGGGAPWYDQNFVGHFFDPFCKDTELDGGCPCSVVGMLQTQYGRTLACADGLSLMGADAVTRNTILPLATIVLPDRDPNRNPSCNTSPWPGPMRAYPG